LTAPGTIGQRHRRARIPHRRSISVGPASASKFGGPKPPGCWKAAQLAKYRRERNAFTVEPADALGRCVIVIEV
jgi:hypothetical protein